ncbi:MAG: ABC transporter ATP-binding protein [Salinivirgaceae bacterium]|nr:ABC transporter ATP-binding protein [Salinivirgaceae bacterium]
MPAAIKIENLSKQYRLGVIGTGTLSHDLNRWWTVNVLRREDPYLKIGETNDRATRGNSDYVWALKDINMEIEQGDVVGIIGKNGAGKSTLLKLLSRVTKPTTGTIKYRGRIASLLEVGTGFHSEMTGRENIYMNGAIMGMTRAEITRKLDEIVDFSGCERYLDTPVKRYSSGMTVRLGFAIAAHLDPEILVVDEVLAVGDAEFQKKAIGKMQDVSKGEGRTVLFVSHNMESIKSLCSRGILLNNGSIDYMGNVQDTIDKYILKSESDYCYHADFNEEADSFFNFNSAELLCNGSRAKGAIDVFDKISIKFQYTLTCDDSSNCVYILLKKEGRVLAFIIDTTNNKTLLEKREKGTYEVSFSLPCPLLKPGHYSVTLKYTKPRIVDLQTKEDCLRFDVSLMSQNEYDAGYAKNRDGIIAVNPELSIVKVG